jgi:hypothetical protein
MLNAIILSYVALSVFMLNVIMLSYVMLSVVMLTHVTLSVTMLSVYLLMPMDLPQLLHFNQGILYQGILKGESITVS